MDYFTPETQNALNSLMELADFPQRGKQVTHQVIQDAVDKLRGQVLQVKLASPGSSGGASGASASPGSHPPLKAPPANHEPGGPAHTPTAEKPTPQAPPGPVRSKSSGGGSSHAGARPNFKHVMIVSQTGFITHQLRQTLGKMGAEVTIATDVNSALASYKNHDFGLVIIDLNMPTETEGLLVLDEIHRISVICRIKTDIIVLYPPTKDKTIKETCKNKGATIFMTKNEGWHNLVVEYFRGDIDLSHFTDPS